MVTPSNKQTIVVTASFSPKEGSLGGQLGLRRSSPSTTYARAPRGAIRPDLL